MSSEEKILEMLSQMQTDISGIKGDISGMKSDISELQKNVTRVALTQENIVLPQIKLLAEGHETLLNTLAPKSRTEALEEDMALMKAAFKAMSQRIAELEKAQ